jgi:hypothetical protein
MWLPEDDLQVVTLSNAGDVSAMRLARQIVVGLLGLPEHPRPGSFPLDKRLVGWWVDDLDGTAMEVTGGGCSNGLISGHLAGEIVGVQAEPKAALVATDGDLRLRADDVLETCIEGGHDRYFRRSEHWLPDDYGEFAGSYRCDGLDLTWELAATANGLAVLRDGEPVSFFGREPVQLEPLTTDRFSGELTLRFERSSGAIDGFRLDVTRARNLRFARLT